MASSNRRTSMPSASGSGVIEPLVLARYWPLTLALRRRAIQARVQHREQPLGVDGLGQVVAGTDLQAAVAVTLHGLGGERDHRKLRELQILTDTAHRLVAI